MKHNIIKLILFLLLIPVLNSCRVVLDTKPAIGVLPEKPEPEESRIILPLSIDLKKLEDVFNSSIPSGKIVRVQDPGCKRTEYKIDVFRNRPFKLGANGNKLIVETNLDLIGRAKHCAGIHSNCGCTTGWCKADDVDIDLALKIEVNLNVDSKYNVQAAVKLNGKITDGDELEVKCGSISFKLPLKDIIGDIDKQLKPLEQSVNTQINNELKKFNLKNEITKVWNTSHQNVPLDQLVLKVIPENLYFKNFTSSANSLELQTGVGLLLNVTTLVEDIPIAPLPDLTILNIDESGFQIDLPVDGEFSVISKNLTDLYANKKYKFGSSWVKINEINIYGGKIGDEAAVIIFDLDINGKIGWFRKVEGNLFFTAKPELDTKRNIISLDDFKLTANSDSEILNKKVEFLINKFYYDDISKAAVYNFDDDLKKMENEIRNELSNIKIGDYQLKLALEKIAIDGLYITTKVLGIESSAKGKISKIPVQNK